MCFFIQLKCAAIAQCDYTCILADEGGNSKITMRPGEKTNTSIIVQNYGDTSSTYSLSASVRVSGSNGTVNVQDFVSYCLSIQTPWCSMPTVLQLWY